MNMNLKKALLLRKALYLKLSLKLNTCMDTGLKTANKTCKTLVVNLIRRYSSEGEAVYMVAAMGVVMNTTTGNQRFYGGD